MIDTHRDPKAKVWIQCTGVEPDSLAKWDANTL